MTVDLEPVYRHEEIVRYAILTQILIVIEGWYVLERIGGYNKIYHQKLRGNSLSSLNGNSKVEEHFTSHTYYTRLLFYNGSVALSRFRYTLCNHVQRE